VPAGKPAADARTVNGSIRVDDNATIASGGTVNGNIHLGAHSSAASVQSVNGGISLDAGAHVSGAVGSVNGALTLADGAEVLGGLSNVNGKISLTGAHVASGIKTVNGSMSIMGASRVEGGILVAQGSGGLFLSENPLIVIGPGAKVEGELRFEHKVRLYVSDTASIGTVIGATPVPFTGDNPPP
jgi:DUF4097 and DUF4098 domain-containing protein YvlB